MHIPFVFSVKLQYPDQLLDHYFPNPIISFVLICFIHLL